ncbi:MAG TPA: hypothetical protein VK932_03945, partial [Kofleriaceae bacterium]|nr:hypothetical protein [Kofleriaceae bacterium]
MMALARRAPARGRPAAPAVPAAPPRELAADEVSRHAVRLVALDRRTGRVALRPFAALPELLGPGDLVVVN